MAVVDEQGRFNGMLGEDGLLSAVFRQSQGHRLAVGTNAGGLDLAAVVHEAFKFHDAGLEVEVNDVLVVTNGRCV